MPCHIYSGSGVLEVFIDSLQVCQLCLPYSVGEIGSGHPEDCLVSRSESCISDFKQPMHFGCQTGFLIVSCGDILGDSKIRYAFVASHRFCVLLQVSGVTIGSSLPEIVPVCRCKAVLES